MRFIWQTFGGHLIDQSNNQTLKKCTSLDIDFKQDNQNAPNISTCSSVLEEPKLYYLLFLDVRVYETAHKGIPAAPRGQTRAANARYGATRKCKIASLLLPDETEMHLSFMVEATTSLIQNPAGS